MTVVSGAFKILFAIIGGGALLLLLLAAWGQSEHRAYSRMSSSERLAAERVAELEAAAQRRRQAERNLAEHSDGRHCLGTFNGEHAGIVEYVTERLREPDSFEHVATVIDGVDKSGQHLLKMKYRARNGFGGMNVETAQFSVANADCTFHPL